MKRIITLIVILLSMSGYSQNTCQTATVIPTGTYTTGVIDGTNYMEGCWNNTGMEGNNAEWYVYTPTADGIARLTTNFAVNDGITLSNDIQVSVYTGNCNELYCHYAQGGIGSPPPTLPDFKFEVRTGTTYYIAFDNYASNKGLQFSLSLETPTCNNTLPFAETWQTHLGFTCWETYNTNTVQRWVYYNVANFNEDPAKDPVAACYPSVNATVPKNEWIVSPEIQLEAGVAYTVSVKYNALQSGGPGGVNESFRTVILDNVNPQIATETELGQVDGIVQQGGHVEPYNMDLATTVTYSYTPAAAGSYHLGLHAISPATSGVLLIYEVKVTQGVLASQEFKSDSFSIYPNPAIDKVIVQPNDNTRILSVSIIDINGRTVGDYSASEIDITTMASGIYFIKVESDKGTAIKKIIKK